MSLDSAQPSGTTFGDTVVAGLFDGAKETVANEINRFIEELALHPGSTPLIADLWFDDTSRKEFDLEYVIVDWLEETGSRVEILEWADGLERVAARLRKTAHECDYAED